MNFHRMRGLIGVFTTLLLTVIPLTSQATRKAAEVTVKQGYALIPLSYYRDANRLFVDVKINGKPATLLLDTGAPFCLLPPEALLHFGLTPAFAEKGPSKGKREVKMNGEAALLATAKDFSIGPVHSTDLKLAEVLAMSGMVGHFTQGELKGMGVDGILGANFLLEHEAVLDVQRHELFVKVDPKAPDIFSSTLPKAKWTAVPFTVGDTKLFVSGQVEGVATRFIMDTGAPFTALSAEFCRQAGIRGSFFTFESGVMGYGDARESKGKVKDLRVGPYSVQNMELAVSPSLDRAFRQFNLSPKKIAGLLGMDFLGNNLAFIDYRNRTLYLKKP